MLKKFPCVVFLLVATGISSSDVAVFDNGRILEIESAEAMGDEIKLILVGGGELVLPSHKIDRILEAEKTPSAEVAPKDATKYDDLLVKLCNRYGVDIFLVKALIRVESDFRPDAVSVRGAMGLMQLMPQTARQYNVSDPFNPEENLSAGIEHLAFLLAKYDDLELALAAYNAGEKAVARYGGVPPFKETRNYVKRILALYGG